MATDSLEIIKKRIQIWNVSYFCSCDFVSNQFMLVILFIMALTNSHKVDLIEAYFLNYRSRDNALKWYQERYPDRVVPNRKIFDSLIKNLRQEGCFKPKRKRPTIVNSEFITIAVLGYFEAYPKASLREAAETIGIHKSTVRKILKAHKYKCYIEGRLVQALLPGDKDRRLHFCNWYVAQTIRNRCFPNFIIWTDECNFSNNGMYNRRNNHYWSKINPLRTTETHNQIRFSFNCWCAILHNRIFAIKIYQGTLNSEKYQEILNMAADLVDETISLRNFGKIIYQQDGAPAHNSRASKLCLDEQFPNRWMGTYGPIKWPPRSPDLTPLDFFLWGYLKGRIYVSRYNSVQELKDAVYNTLNTIHHKSLLNATRSVLKRARTCIRQDGGHIEHLLK